MDEMYEIAQQAKYRFFGVSEMYKICDGLNVQNRLISFIEFQYEYCRICIVLVLRA